VALLQQLRRIARLHASDFTDRQTAGSWHFDLKKGKR